MSGLNSGKSIEVVAPDWTVPTSDYVTALVCSPDGLLLAVASAAGPILLLQSATGELVHRLDGHANGTLALSWSCDGQRLASGGQDGLARVWSVTDGALQQELVGGSAWIEALAYAPDDRRLATAAGKQLRVWDDAGRLLHAYPDHASTVTLVAWRRNGRELASSCYGGVKLWHVGDPAACRHFEWKGSMLSLCLSPDDRYLASGCQDTNLFVWDIATGENLGMSGYPGKIALLDWSRSSRWLGSVAGRDAVLWDFSGNGPAKRDPLVLSRHVDRINALRFSPRQEVLATGGQEGLMIVWELPKARIAQLSILDAPLSQLAWHPDGHALAAGMADGAVSWISLFG